MAIVFDCPHCKEPYKLKDEFAGRKATSKSTDCRQQITIPSPPSAAELEVAAHSALADEAAKREQAAAAETSFPRRARTASTNGRADVSRKNVLCPNPECRRRIRVPSKGIQPWTAATKYQASKPAKQAHELREWRTRVRPRLYPRALPRAGDRIEYEPGR